MNIRKEDETMNIIIEDPVMNYLSKKKRTVLTLEIKTVRGGWCGNIKVQGIGYEAPPSLENYSHFEVNGIDVYVLSNVTGETITFQVQKALFFKSIYAAGIDHECMLV